MGKQLETSKTVKVIDEIAYVAFDSIPYSKYINNSSPETYRSKFVSGCTGAFAADNITVVSEGQDFTLVLTSIKLKEYKTEHTVDDPDSEFNGQSYYLHTCEVTATADLYKGNRLEKIDSFTVSADKEEKVKNNRNLGDLITGDNKDNNTYRHKELFDNVFEGISEKCGRRIEAETSSTLFRLIKKGKV